MYNSHFHTFHYVSLRDNMLVSPIQVGMLKHFFVMFNKYTCSLIGKALHYFIIQIVCLHGHTRIVQDNQKHIIYVINILEIL